MSKKRKNRKPESENVEVSPSENINTKNVFEMQKSSGVQPLDSVIPLQNKSMLSYLKNNVWKTAVICLLAIGILGAGGKYLQENGEINKEYSQQKTQKGTSVSEAQNNSNNTNYSSSATNTSLQVAKDYVYSGSRLVAVEEPGATMQPPSDLAVWRPTSGAWYVMAADGGLQAAVQWGLATDVPVPGDFDGDGKTDFSIYRPGTAGNPATWWILKSSTSTTSSFTVTFGQLNDIPVAADFDGDGQFDIAVWRPANGSWHIFSSLTQEYYSVQFGLSGDTLVPADYDGDGKADIAVWRSGDTTWYIWQSSNNSYRYEVFGTSQDKVMPGDYDGDGKIDLAVWQPDNIWKIKQSGNGSVRTVQWGVFASDKAVQGDYDADGKTDVAIWRPSTGDWWIEQSAQNYQVRSTHWGQNGDIPVPAPYRR